MNSSIFKKFIVPLVLALLAIFIQGSLLRFSFPNTAIPNLVLILIVFLGFFEASPLGALLAFLIGIEADLCSGVLIGPSAGAYCFVFGTLVALSTRLFVESSFAVVLTVFIASITSSLIYLILVFQFSPSVGRSFLSILSEAILTAAIAPFFFSLLKRVMIPRRDRQSSRMGSRPRTRLTSQ